MGNTELTQEKKREEFQKLKDFLDEVEIVAEIAEKGKLFEDTVLLVSLPTAEELTEDRELTEEELHLAAGYLMEPEEKERRLTRYLMFYTRIYADLSELTRAEVLSMVNELNRKVRIGNYFLGPMDGGEEAVQYRIMMAGIPGEPVDEGLVADTLLEMGNAYDVAAGALKKANDEMRRRRENG